MDEQSLTLEHVKEYYGKVLGSQKDLKTSACCTADAMPERISDILREIHPEVRERFYGCGSPIPPLLAGCTVLDLGCGSGRDCFVLSKLVGEGGSVIGIDMTEEQLKVASRYIGYHTEKFGYRSPNVCFRQGYIEDLESSGIPSASVDVVISNCVLNLSPNKNRVFSEIFRVLKPGGELYFSDVFSSRRIPKHLASDSILLGECLGGALYTEDFRRILYKIGIPDYRVVSQSTITLNDNGIVAKAGMIDFYSITIRAFNLETLEDRCEDYGQVAYYLGTVPECPHTFVLDNHHVFKTGMPLLICSNTANMLTESRFKPHFKVIGDTSTHYGLFDCAPKGVTPTGGGTVGACC